MMFCICIAINITAADYLLNQPITRMIKPITKQSNALVKRIGNAAVSISLQN